MSLLKLLKKLTIKTGNTKANGSDIGKLIDEAKKYSHENPRKALDLYKEIIKLAPDASNSKSKQEDIVYTEFACMEAFYCKQALMNDSYHEKPSILLDDDEFSDLFGLIKKKSPSGAESIKEIIAADEEAIKRGDEAINRLNTLDQIENEILSLCNEDNYDTKIISEKIKEVSGLCDANNEWWRLRNLAYSLEKTPLSYDFSWSLYNRALLVRMKLGGDLSTIYKPMGYLRKKENNYTDAVRYFVLAFVKSGPSRTPNPV